MHNLLIVLSRVKGLKSPMKRPSQKHKKVVRSDCALDGNEGREDPLDSHNYIESFVLHYRIIVLDICFQFVWKVICIVHCSLRKYNKSS